MINLQSVQQASLQHGIKCMVYGRAGLGKTVLTATCPSPVLISAESGTLSLRKNNLEKLFGVGNPTIAYDFPVIEIRTIDELIEAEVWARTSHEAGQFQTVAIDSVSEIAEVVLSNAKAQVKDPRQAYGELIDKMQKTIKAFRDLSGKHVYMSAKEERIKDEATNTTLNGPAMPGSKLGSQVPYLFDEVFQLSMATDPNSGVYRFLRTQPDFSNQAKDRSGVLAELEYPHLGDIFNKIMSST
ncbi:AAA domain protein [Vibrio phage 2.117.O._10N.261.45.E9]|nr:AAA domain protein [Vibrio phage 1.117.O._10N.261.45.E9]AUR95472.1 AAA domain protein [Vibrio phage 1.207.B._10N.222.51.C2]AUS02363.1 AAA domain protein [Vibrio phage 2.117.O._10N.261.45.E9]